MEKNQSDRVARIESTVSHEPGGRGRVDRLERQGLIRRATGALEPDLLATRPPRAKGEVSALSLLLEERKTGR